MRSFQVVSSTVARSIKASLNRAKLIAILAIFITSMLPRTAQAIPLMYLTINDVSVTESDSGQVNAVFTVSLDQKNGNPVTVDYATEDATAVAGKDYTATSGRLTMRVTKTATITVPILNDLIDEPDQSFKLKLTNATDAIILDGEGIGTIVDDDQAPVLSMGAVTTLEGDTGTLAATFNMALSEASEKPVYVKYRTVEETASAGTDFIAEETTVSFPVGERTATPSVDIVGDILNEVDETFKIVIFEASDVYLAQVEAQATILNDDPAPMIDINDVVLQEDSGSAVFTVRLSRPSGQQVSVSYAASNGVAKAPADYQASSGQVNFGIGETTKQVSVPIVNDSLDEADETFKVTLSSPTNAVIGDPEGEATILDEDAQPQMSISDASVTEGDSGQAVAVFTVTLSSPSGRTVVADYGVTPGSASPGADYGAVNGPVAFLEGETSKQVQVPIASDTTDEHDETFTVLLSNPYFADITDAEGLGTIVDDDAAPSLSIADASASEGAGSAQLVVALSAVSGKDISVKYATSGGTASSGRDFTGATGTLQIPAGQAQGAISVGLIDDAIDEDDESASVSLSNPVNVSVADGDATLTISDDDLPPTISIADATVLEGNSGTTPVQVAVTLSEASGKPITVSYATAAGSASASDFSAASGSLSFAPGERLAQVQVSAAGDLVDETDEAFNLNLSSPSNATLADSSGQVTIVDDDSAPTLVVEDATVNESSSGITFNVRLSNPSGLLVTADYATEQGTATEDYDYIPKSGGLTFLPGQNLKQVVVPIYEDSIDEVNETLSLNISNATNVTVADGTGIGTIVDNDAPPSVSIYDASVDEGDSGTTQARFGVILSAPSEKITKVNYATQHHTTDSSDYQSVSGTLVFNPGQTWLQVTVNVLGDTTSEDDEYFYVHLSSPVDLTIAGSPATGMIRNDDSAIRVDDVSVIEGPTASQSPGATKDAVFTVSIYPPAASDVTVNFTTAGRSANDEISGPLSRNTPDFKSASGSVTFAAGETARQVVVKVISDLIYEPTETFELLISSTHLPVIRPWAAATIIDDDLPPPQPHTPSGCGRGPEGFYSSLRCTFSHGTAPVGDLHYGVIRAEAVAGPIAPFCIVVCSPLAIVHLLLDGPTFSPLACAGFTACAIASNVPGTAGPWSCDLYATSIEFFATFIGQMRCDLI